MALRRKGFISTLEAVVASTIFLLFIINAAPTFSEAGTAANDITVNKIENTLSSLDRSGTLREDMMARNLSDIEEQIDDYLVPLNVAVGLFYTNTTEGTFTDDSIERTFHGNQTIEEQSHLRLWIERADSVVVRVNGETAIRTSRNGYIERDITDLTISGSNTINISGEGGNLDFMVEQYRYQESQGLPSDADVTSNGYQVAGKGTKLQPTELRVFAWQ